MAFILLYQQLNKADLFRNMFDLICVYEMDSVAILNFIDQLFWIKRNFDKSSRTAIKQKYIQFASVEFLELVYQNSKHFISYVCVHMRRVVAPNLMRITICGERL